MRHTHGSRNRTRLIGVLFCALTGLAFGVSSAQAQTLVRCGSTYQDHPCEDGQAGKVVGKINSSGPGVSPVADAACAQRGAVAQKIVWAREGGASQERALQNSSVDRGLVDEVYNMRGSATEVRAAIEANCVAEKARARQPMVVIMPPNAGAAGQPESGSK